MSVILRLARSVAALLVIGTVIGATYMGSFTDYKVDLGGNAVVRVQASRLERYEIGTRLPVEIAPRDAIGMRKEAV